MFLLYNLQNNNLIKTYMVKNVFVAVCMVYVWKKERNRLRIKMNTIFQFYFSTNMHIFGNLEIILNILLLLNITSSPEP